LNSAKFTGYNYIDFLIVSSKILYQTQISKAIGSQTGKQVYELYGIREEKIAILEKGNNP